MNKIAQIQEMINTLPTKQERLFLKCYVYRKVLHKKYLEIAQELKMSSREVQSNSEKASLLWDLTKPVEERATNIQHVLTACEDLAITQQLKSHRNHLRGIECRVTQSLRAQHKQILNR